MISMNKLYYCSSESTTMDPNYRYITNAPVYNIGKKKGASITYFTNSNAISSYLKIEHSIFIKLIGLELSCQYSIDKELNCGLFKGHYESLQINNIICSIIANYFLCPSCDYPEISFCIKHKSLRQKCGACGKKYYIRDELSMSKTYQTLYKYVHDLDK